VGNRPSLPAPRGGKKEKRNSRLRGGERIGISCYGSMFASQGWGERETLYRTGAQVEGEGRCLSGFQLFKKGEDGKDAVF